MTKLAEVYKAMQDSGFFPSELIPDGKIHRFHRMKGEKSKDAWYLLFQNTSSRGEELYVCTFGDWREWSSEYKFITSFTQTKHEKRIIEDKIEEAQKRIEAERARIHDEVSESSAREFAKYRSHGETDYMVRKKIPELYGAKIFPGILIVPMRDVSGKFWGYQEIYDDGRKLFREGMKKEGSCHIIGEIGEADTIYFCEGFATGASIHQATKKPVVVAFDSGNLPKVVKEFRKEIKDAAFVICGDDDRWTEKPDGSPHNPGREAAEKAAKDGLGKAIFPEFSSLEGKPTDFNDLHCLESLDAVERQIIGVKLEFHRVVCLGHLGDTYFYISSSNQQIVSFPRGGHSKTSLLDLMPMAYWESQYPKKNGADFDLAASDLMEGCRRAGVFQPERVRGAGVWRDNGRTVVNLGNCLYIDGKSIPLNSYKSKNTYQISSRIDGIHDRPLTKDEGQNFVNALELMRWQKPEFSKLMAGWIMIAPLAGSLPWRPHVWLTAPSGSGKSWFMNSVVNKIFGDNRFFFQGNTTEAGIRQTVYADARPVIFDEFETDDRRSSERIQGLLELIRQASSESDGHVVKGSSTGKSAGYRVRFSALVASVRLNLQREQDKNRFTILELERGAGESAPVQFRKLKAALACVQNDFGQRMFSRGVKMLPIILENLEKLHFALSEKYNSRFGQQYGALLAGYGALIHDRALTDDETVWLVDSLDLKEEAEVIEERDESECLDHLLRHIISVDLRSYGRRDTTINELIREIRKGGKPEYIEECKIALQRIGVKLSGDDFFIAVRNSFLAEKVFANTRWVSGWDKPVMRLRGATKTTARMVGVVTKCIKVPVTEGVTGVKQRLGYTQDNENIEE